jgi:peptidoglycan/xylan/chitin deacetylase (PgdA/CDA1 family)
MGIATIPPLHAAKPPQKPQVASGFAATVCEGGAVGLTFDDGPGPNTPAVLDALRAAQLRATFFLVGYNASTYPDMVRRIVDEGHAIGNHTFSHVDLTTMTSSEIEREIQMNADLIQSIIGVRPRFVRPPFGATNKRVRAKIAELGLIEVLWTVDSKDWNGADTATILNQVTRVQPGGIVLMHDRMPTTLAAIPSIAWYFRQFWAASPICPGQLAPTSHVVPAEWLGAFFFAHAVPW